MAIAEISATFFTTFIFQTLIDQDSKKFIMRFFIVAEALTFWAITKFISDYYLEKECEILKTKMRKFIFRSYSSGEGQKKISKEPGAFKSITIDNVDKYVDGYIKSKYLIVLRGTKVIISISFMFYISWIIGNIAIVLCVLSIVLRMIISPHLSKSQNIYVNQLNQFNDNISKNLDYHSVFYLNNSTNKIVVFFK